MKKTVFIMKENEEFVKIMIRICKNHEIMTENVKNKGKKCNFHDIYIFFPLTENEIQG